MSWERHFWLNWRYFLTELPPGFLSPNSLIAEEHNLMIMITQARQVISNKGKFQVISNQESKGYVLFFVDCLIVIPFDISFVFWIQRYSPQSPLCQQQSSISVSKSQSVWLAVTNFTTIRQKMQKNALEPSVYLFLLRQMNKF
jgi:hypothetical protein